MRIGVVLPSFRTEPDEALTAAAEAERVGVDGVFCYDHLWPMGQPERPAIAPFPLLAAIVARSPGLVVGPLVARVGLVPAEVLVAQFAALSALAPGRVVAPLGTGDHKSADENMAYGIPFASAEERRSEMAVVARNLTARGVPVWIGAGSSRTVAMAEAESLAVNLWNAQPDEVADQAGRSEVTWAGTVPAGGPAMLLEDLATAGATWAVFAWPVDLGLLAEAARGLAPGR